MNDSYAQNIAGVLFMTAALLSFVSFSSVPNYVEQRSIFNRFYIAPSFSFSIIDG